MHGWPFSGLLHKAIHKRISKFRTIHTKLRQAIAPGEESYLSVKQGDARANCPQRNHVKVKQQHALRLLPSSDFDLRSPAQCSELAKKI
jgi:hypothetical protein